MHAPTEPIHVAVAPEEQLFVVDQAGLAAPLPRRARVPVACTEPTDVPTPNRKLLNVRGVGIRAGLGFRKSTRGGRQLLPQWPARVRFPGPAVEKKSRVITDSNSAVRMTVERGSRRSLKPGRRVILLPPARLTGAQMRAFSATYGCNREAIVLPVRFIGDSACGRRSCAWPQAACATRLSQWQVR